MPENPLESAAPPVRARVLAFIAILVGGASGALIGFAVVDLQCHGSCGTAKGLGLLTGAAVAAIGVAVVSVLVLRAMGEWRTIQLREQRAVVDERQVGSRSRRNPSA